MQMYGVGPLLISSAVRKTPFKLVPIVFKLFYFHIMHVINISFNRVVAITESVWPTMAGCPITATITELEKTISFLYQLREEENRLDSLVTVGPAAATTEALELDLTIPCPNTAADQPQCQDHWTQLGAKPKS